jgi:hypothetical protein
LQLFILNGSTVILLGIWVNNTFNLPHPQPFPKKGKGVCAQVALEVYAIVFLFINSEPTPKSQKPLNPLKGTLKSSLIFNEFPFRGQG